MVATSSTTILSPPIIEVDMSKMTPAKIWGCVYLGKIGNSYCYCNLLGCCPLLGGNFKFKRFPTAERVKAIFVNVIGFKYLVK